MKAYRVIYYYLVEVALVNARVGLFIILILLYSFRKIEKEEINLTPYSIHSESSHLKTSNRLNILRVKQKFTGRRVLYYSNADSTFNLQIVQCGDVELNPGPSLQQPNASSVHLTAAQENPFNFEKYIIKYDRDTLHTIVTLSAHPLVGNLVKTAH